MLNHPTFPTPAHWQQEPAHPYEAYYPEHLPRPRDPHYHLFEAARKRLLACGGGCWRCGERGKLECHHNQVEFAVANGCDREKLARDFPQYAFDSDEAFLEWVESEGNLLILCAKCHRGPIDGIHSIPYPTWIWKRWAKDGIDTTRALK